MASNLPTELKCEVAKYLWHDYASSSLRSLSLASKDWTAPAQSFLFRHFTVRLTSNVHLKTARSLATFLDTYEHVRQYVLELLLIGPESGPVELFTPQLLSYIGFLPALRHLKVYSTRILDSHRTQVLRRAARLISLTLLNVEMCAPDLFLLINQCAGPVLCLANVLATSTAPVASWPISAISTKRKSLTLRRFCIRGHNLPSTFAPDVLELCTDTLETLAIEWIFYDNISGSAQHLCKFIRTKGHNIVHLRLDLAAAANALTAVSCTYILANLFRTAAYSVFRISRPFADAPIVSDRIGEDGFGGIDPTWETVDLSNCCPQLKTLTMILRVGSQRTYSSNEGGMIDIMTTDFWSRLHHAAILVWRYALRLLASALSRNSLTSVAIGLHFDLPDNTSSFNIKESTLHLLDWKKWDEVLGGFKDLKELKFMCMTHFENLAFREPYEPCAQFPETILAHLRTRIEDELPSLQRKNVVVRFD